MNRLISIIIPIYNVEQYLSYCLDSVLKQDYSDIEVICVEDCSTDNSRAILKEYEAIDPRITAIYNQYNVGLGEARNIGVEAATGDYVWFVDSDDWIEKHSISNLVGLLQESSSDIICFGMQIINEMDDTHLGSISYTNIRDCLSPILGEDALCYFIRNNEYDGTVCSKLFRREFLLENDFCFIRGILHEDTLFLLFSMLAARNVVSVKENYYCYRKRNGSITTSEKKKFERFVSLLRIVYEMIQYSVQHSEVICNEGFFIYFTAKISDIINRYREIDCIDREDLKKYQNLIPILLSYVSTLYNGFFPFKLSAEVMGILRGTRQLYVYGAGRVGDGFKQLMDERRIPIKAFLVSHDENNEEGVSGINCIPIQALKNHNLQKCIVAIMVKDKAVQEEMKNNAKRIGFEDNQILTYSEISGLKVRI